MIAPAITWTPLASPDLPGPSPVEPLPTAPLAPGQEPIEGEAYVTLLLLFLIAALLTFAILVVLIAAWRGLTGASKGDEPEWLAVVALAGAVAIMYVFSEPMFALFRIVVGPLWLAILIPFLLIAIVALLGLVVGAVGQVAGSIAEHGWEGIIAWCVVIAIALTLVLTLNLYFDWDIWWSLAGAFGLYTVGVLAAFGLYSILKPKE